MSAIETYQKLFANIETVMRGQSQSIRKLLAAFFIDGHVLLEDVPGTGKTTLARALAQSIDLDFQRIQFTPDLLPTDILGVSIYNQKLQEFEFHPGPVFSNILLADEINRASPRTQSALLEAMGEKQVTIERTIHQLDELFFVIATQNPIEYHGTYPLPEAQMDRFTLRFRPGYVSAAEEINILDQQRNGHPLDGLCACLDLDDIRQLKRSINHVAVSDEIKQYLVAIVRATRNAEGIINGASPRASLALIKCARALACFDGLDYVTPDHIQELAVDVIAHRLLLASSSEFSGMSSVQLVDAILADTPVPA